MGRIRLTGVSSPWGGAQWERKDDDREVARRVLNLLGDMRLLWEDWRLEVMEDCAQSASRARQALGVHLDNPEISDGFAAEVRGLQRLFRDFMTELQQAGKEGWPTHNPSPYGADPLAVALGRLRGRVGEWVGRVAVAYEISVSYELATTLPWPDPETWFWEPDGHDAEV